MNAPKMFFGIAGAVVLAALGTSALVGCSSDSSAAGPTTITTVDSGNPGNDATIPADDSGSTPSPDSGAGDAQVNSDAGLPGCVADGGAAATCNSCAAVGHDTYNTCTSFGCQGHFDNTAHGVPSPLPSVN